ncbi:hypothetical protein BS78_09G048600 [Paspalum vaginatum]|nr:hypothetical protein BS78_09G048600 [Paspalum vaginatum]
MRVIRDYQDGAIMQNHHHAAQYSSLVARAGEAWNEWEVQCLVMTSFTLQVFLLLSAPFRKRHRSRALNGSLWVAYLMADYVATYLLGRLTLLVAVAGNGERQQLALFWAPFLLLHLGGQETITTFSTEDNTLWKRRLLDLAAQVAMAVYLVGKQWRGDRLLVAPMALMFVCGAVRYGERVWALRAAAKRSSAIPSLDDQDSYPGGPLLGLESVVMDHYKRLGSIISGDKKLHASTIEPILKDASMDFQASLDFFMDVTPSDRGRRIVLLSGVGGDDIKGVLMELKSSKNAFGVAYKLAEVQISLIYDYLYTKFGTVRFQASKSSSNPAMWAALQWLGSLGLTSAALVLFARASNHYSGANAVISYILLVGALVMEISSIFIALLSSYWAGSGVAKHLHPCSGVVEEAATVQHD